MVPVKKQQKVDVIPENVKRPGGETLMSTNEMLRLMAKKKNLSFRHFCCTIAEQSPLTTFSLQTQGVWFQWHTLGMLLQH